jgi:hypothetical protein
LVLGWLRRRLDVVLFALDCAVLVFLARMVAGQAKLFPYPPLHAVSEAWDDWRENRRHYLGLRSKHLEPTTRTAGVVVDPKTWLVRWAMSGPLMGQHDPDFLPDGHILVHDNRIAGALPRFGNTRLVEPGYVGLVTDVQRVTRDAVPWPGQPCPKGGLAVAGP